MKAIRHFAWALAVLIPLVVTPKALAANVFPGVGTVDFNQSANTLTLVIPYHARNPYRVQWLSGQNRLVVDVEGMSLPGNRAMYIGMGVVQQIRASRGRGTTTRFIFDLTQSADLRTVTDAGSRTLTLTIFPRGGAPGRYSYVPGPRPTRRPVPPLRPIYQGNTTDHMTPSPVQPSFEPIQVPTPTPLPAYTPMPTPEPTFVPQPLPTSPDVSPSPEQTGEQPVFGSRFVVGATLPLGITETNAGTTNPADADDLSVPFDVGGTVEWDQMFGQTPYFGFGIATNAISYTLNDTQATEDGVMVTHLRNDYSIAAGPRGRLPLPAGFELFLQPGVLVRYVTVTSTAQPLNAADSTPNGPATTPLLDSSYLNSGWTGFGAQVQGGVGYRVGGPLSLAVIGEYNALFTGSMAVTGATSIFPLTGYRVGGEARLDFGLLDLTLGYNLTSDGNSTIGLSQSSSGPYVKVGVAY